MKEIEKIEVKGKQEKSEELPSTPVTVEQAKIVSKTFLKLIELEKAVDFGLPEIDDRYHIWRVPVKSKTNEVIGEIVIDALTTLINEKKTTNKDILESRLLGRRNGTVKKRKSSSVPL